MAGCFLQGYAARIARRAGHSFTTHRRAVVSPSCLSTQDLMTRFLHFVVFALGLAVTCWIGASYVASNPLALSVTVLVGIVYLVGAFELYRYQRATTSLVQALEAMPDAVVSLDEWLARLHPSLRNATRLRIEGERVGLPGPSLTPYLVGLLVLLGMLGTFL